MTDDLQRKNMTKY